VGFIFSPLSLERSPKLSADTVRPNGLALSRRKRYIALKKYDLEREAVGGILGGRLGQAKDLCHTVKSHSVASSGTNSGYIDSNGSVVWGAYPILEYHWLRKFLLGCVQWRGVSISRRIV
jgi:hypothetical protein